MSVRFVQRAAAVVLGLAAMAAGAQQPYHVVDHWKLGGTGGWDYLLADPGAHRLYITHGPRVEVIDSKTGKPIGAITGLKGTHGVVLDEEGRFGYISDGGANSVVVFDRSNLQKVAEIPAGTNPDGIAYEPVTKTVWAFNGRSQNATVIDTKTRKVVATIPLPGKPEFPQADGNGRVFDNIESKSEIVALDAHSRTLTATWPLAGCDSPSGMSIDRAHHRVFSVCDGKKMVQVDTLSGKVTSTAEIGEGPDAAGFSPEHQLAFSSNGEGTFTVVDASHGSLKSIEQLPTQRGARTMAYDEKQDRAFVVTAEMGPRSAPTPQNPHGWPNIKPDTFTVIVIGR